MADFRETISVIDGEHVKMITVNTGAYTAFAGVADNKAVSIVSSLDRKNELLIRAVNNRTRERNYFRLYTQLLEKEITDEEIESNEDEYVVSNNEDADINDINIALSLCPYLKDVKDVDEMADLFSFNNDSINKSLLEK